MFIKSLTISTPLKVIRKIEFSSGLNLILDNTPTTDIKLTGNNVGKTTVLKLIDVCLGADPKTVYSDTENKKAVYDTVKNFLIDKAVQIELVLADDLEDENSRQLIVERNFLPSKNAIRKINGEDILDKDFEAKLLNFIFPKQEKSKPTFRQIISHNIRYKDWGINNTLKTLSEYTSDVEYETLYLFLLGVVGNFDGAKKEAIHKKINQEEVYKKRLENKQTQNTYEFKLDIINEDIIALNKKKDSFNFNEDFENDLAQLNKIKYQINKASSKISKMNIRKDIILEAKSEMEQNVSKIDLPQLEVLYNEVSLHISGIQKTFNDLVSYHNTMIVEKIKFITAELPELIKKIKTEEAAIKELLKEEKWFTEKVSKGDSFEEFEKIIVELNEKHQIKGEYETIISQLKEVDKNLADLKKELEYIDKVLFSGNVEEMLKTQIKKFNTYFSTISNELYGEKYALNYEKVISKKKEQIYKFCAFNANTSSGKKQGEILCFDLAYTLFADAEDLSCLHFLLNDKKELMHDNQLNKVCDFLGTNNVQLVASILKDKLPAGLIAKAHVALELSPQDKLFRIEEGSF
ncbi:MAG: DUF2326 domain-containing protein [Candidatus Adiutrix sp.]